MGLNSAELTSRKRGRKKRRFERGQRLAARDLEKPAKKRSADRLQRSIEERPREKARSVASSGWTFGNRLKELRPGRYSGSAVAE